MVKNSVTCEETSYDQLLSIVASSTEGYLGLDLQQLLDRALHLTSLRAIQNSKSIQEFSRSIKAEDFTAAQDGFVPISLKGIGLHESETKWSSIGGNSFLVVKVILFRVERGEECAQTNTPVANEVSPTLSE